MKTLVSCIVALIAATSTLIVYYYNTSLGMIQTVLFLGIAIAIFVVFSLKNQRIKENLSRAQKYFEKKGGAIDFPMATVITDAEGYILWYNDFFANEVIGNTVLPSGNIDDILNSTTPSAITAMEHGADIAYGEKKFTVYAESLNEDKPTFCLFFIDNTELKNISEEYYNTRPAIMQLKIDNLEEVYQNYKNSECEMISGELEHILEAWACEYPCLFRRVSSGKYFCIIEERGLAKLCEKKFDVLKQIREYKFEESERSVDITLSIGVGRGKTMLE